jgi:predicted dienelactone hydrolase
MPSTLLLRGALVASCGAVSLASAAPLVVLIHGSGASADALVWIAFDIVERGVIVVAADHPGSARRSQPPEQCALEQRVERHRLNPQAHRQVKPGGSFVRRDDG